MRTDYNSKSIHFTSLGRQKVVAGFDGGRITSDAGVPLLREIARKMKLFERLAGCLADPRDPALIEHDQATMFAQRIMGIACGWEDLNDHDSLRVDPLMQVATERQVDVDRPLASYLRPSNIDACKNSRALLKLLVKRLRQTWPEVKIIVTSLPEEDSPHGTSREIYANQFRLHLSSLAYILLETLRRTALRGTELEKAQVTTIRNKLLKIGAIVITSVRRIVLQLSSAYPLQELFMRIAGKLLCRPQVE